MLAAQVRASQAYFLFTPAFAAACWISANTSAGWETIDAWLDGTEMVLAFMRLAKNCCRDGGIMRSFVEIRYQLGRGFHATAVIASLKWSTLAAFCTVAIMPARTPPT